MPFDGGAPALTALLGNQVDVAALQIGEAIEAIKGGKLTPLAVFSPERIEFLPDVPTVKEQGYDVDVAQYRFMTTPKGTPQDVKDKIVEGMKATFASEKYKKFNKDNSLTPMEIPGDEVVAKLKADQKRYADLVEEYNIDLGEGRTDRQGDGRATDMSERRTPLPTVGPAARPHASGGEGDILEELQRELAAELEEERPPAGGPAYQVAAGLAVVAARGWRAR